MHWRTRVRKLGQGRLNTAKPERLPSLNASQPGRFSTPHRSAPGQGWWRDVYANQCRRHTRTNGRQNRKSACRISGGYLLQFNLSDMGPTTTACRDKVRRANCPDSAHHQPPKTAILARGPRFHGGALTFCLLGDLPTAVGPRVRANLFDGAPC